MNLVTHSVSDERPLFSLANNTHPYTMLARSVASCISVAAAPRIVLRPRFFAAAAAAQSFAVFDEKTQKLSDIVEKVDAKSVTYFTAT